MNAPAFIETARKTVAAAAVPSLERKRLRVYIYLIIGDIISILAGFMLAGLLYHGYFPEAQAMLQAQLFLPLYLTIALYQRVFSIRALTDANYAAFRVLMALLVAALLLNFFAFYAKFNTSFSRVTFTLGLAFSLGLMVSIRLWSARLLKRKWGVIARNVMVLDDGGPAFDLPFATKIRAEDHALAPNQADPHMRHRLCKCLANQEQVIVSTAVERREPWAEILRASGVHGEIVSDAAQHLGILGVTKYESQGCSGLIVSMGPLGLRARVGKRLFDLCVALGGLVFAAPIMLLAAIAIKLEDGGPVLFIQRRAGRANRFFPMLKFRSMRVELGDADGSASTELGDVRLTRVGSFLRRTSIDELPQLLNVLKGDMSIVGPRPHAIGSQAGERLFWEVDQRYWNRHALKPGMTGLAQVRGLRGATRKESDLTERLQSDLEYIATWSLLGDALIVLRTLTVLKHKHAY